ncbi:MAG: dihydroneopterin aldolase [Sedimentisphaerales bacterium]|nr:dihydroneopterin aldolase [Sedimentisphaerales bacterium]
MIIKIKNLRLRTIIGLQDWERHKRQDVLVYLEIESDDETAVVSDDINDSIDYKEIKHRIVDEVESTEFFLIERLAGFILEKVLAHPKVKRATVEIDKPHALRFADSVSVTLSRERK